MTTNQKRQPKGTSTGGEFAPNLNAESTVALVEEAPEVNRGSVYNVRAGSRTPWGVAQYAEHIAPGVVIVGTAGHGGVKLSQERNREIPTALRQSSGWYEEDCESYIPMMIHPVAFSTSQRSVQDALETGKRGVIEWFPNEYEAAFHTILDIGQSSTKDRKTWHEIHANDEVAVSARSWGDDVPEGMVVVSVCRGGRGERGENFQSGRDILVPKNDYDDAQLRQPLGKHSGSFIADSSKGYADVTPPPKAPNPPAPRYRNIDTSRLSSSAKFRAESDLSKRFRFADGRIETVREIIENGGIVGKASRVIDDRGRRRYYLRQAQEREDEPATDTFYALDVSKALWDSVDAPAS